MNDNYHRLSRLRNILWLPRCFSRDKDYGDIQMLKNTSIKFETPAFMVQTSNEISYNNDIV